MIADFQTNIVYLADSLDAKELKKFQAFLCEHGVQVKIIKGTDDYYCRDYMPVQVDENDFVQFIYKPDYYEKEQLDLITNPTKVIIANDLKNIRYSNIILDGGNLVKWEDKVIITDKVLKDNRHQFLNEKDITDQLEKELKCKVFIIPADPEDKVGHSDGMVRFIDRDTVFINDPLGGTRKWQKKFHDTLKKYRLNAVKIPCTLKEKSGTADGLHMNYLHVGNQIVLPEFGKGHKDEEALKLMKDVMGNRYDVITYDAKRFSKNGGVLNCATWSVYQ